MTFNRSVARSIAITGSATLALMVERLSIAAEAFHAISAAYADTGLDSSAWGYDLRLPAYNAAQSTPPNVVRRQLWAMPAEVHLRMRQ
jgi:hypothetical protein